jgi:hypothetical protein
VATLKVIDFSLMMPHFVILNDDKDDRLSGCKTWPKSLSRVVEF